MSNMVPIAAGPVFLPVPMATTWIYVILANIVTLIDHSGFDLPVFQKCYPHDLHHEKFRFNYGGVGWLDFVHGTLYDQRVDETKNK